MLLGPTTLRKSGVGLPFKDPEYHVKSSKYLSGNSSKKFLISQNTFLNVSRKPHHFLKNTPFFPRTKRRFRHVGATRDGTA